MTEGRRLSGASTRKGRPRAAHTVALREAIVELTAEYEVATVRQVFYALVSRGVVPKDETRGYRPVQRQVLELRREGRLPWSFIADSTRWQRKPHTWADVEDALHATARTYRRNLWADQRLRVEVWLEKDALASVIYDITDKWDVSLMVSRGVSSATFLHGAASAANEAFATGGKKTIVFLMFDFDAGGARAARSIRVFFEEHAPGLASFAHLAVTEEQIDTWRLPTRPAKKSDPEASKWGDRAVELDAIPPNLLRALLDREIASVVDHEAWVLAEAYEHNERELLERIAADWTSA